MKNIDENNIAIQKYLISGELVKEEQLLLFSLRTRSFPVKSNYRYLHESDMTCRACHELDSVENEIHLSETCSIFSSERGNGTLNFKEVFGPLKVQIIFIKQFKVLARKWKLLLEIETSTI